MSSKLRFLPVNWKNGMAFSESHLNSEYLANADALRDTAALYINQFNYGLLGGAYQKRSADSFIDNIGSELVQIHYCRAVTRNGSRIEIIDQDWPELHVHMPELTKAFDLSLSSTWYLLLIIDPFTRISIGEIDESESPRRKPFTRPNYSLEIITAEDLRLDDLANAIPLAKFEYTATGLRKVEEYIPPCCKLNSNEKLIGKYEKYDQYLHQLRDHCEQIMEKIKRKRKQEKGSNRLADDIHDLCATFWQYFIDHYDEFKFLFKDLPPIHLVHFFAKLGRKLDFCLDRGYDRSHVLKYFNTYATELSVPQLNEMFSRVFNQNYQHYDLMKSLQHIDFFIQTLEDIFRALKELDYRELAPRNIVTDDGYNTSPIKRSDPGGFRIKGQNRGDNLGDDLLD